MLAGFCMGNPSGPCWQHQRLAMHAHTMLALCIHCVCSVVQEGAASMQRLLLLHCHMTCSSLRCLSRQCWAALAATLARLDFSRPQREKGRAAYLEPERLQAPATNFCAGNELVSPCVHHMLAGMLHPQCTRCCCLVTLEMAPLPPVHDHAKARRGLMTLAEAASS